MMERSEPCFNIGHALSEYRTVVFDEGNKDGTVPHEIEIYIGWHINCYIVPVTSGSSWGRPE